MAFLNQNRISSYHLRPEIDVSYSPQLILGGVSSYTVYQVSYPWYIWRWKRSIDLQIKLFGQSQYWID